MVQQYGPQVSGSFPQNYDNVVEDPNIYGGLLGNFFEGLRRFLLGSNYFKSYPKPFDYMSVREVLVPLNTDVWLDATTFKLRTRRAWAVINTDAVVGNLCWVNSVAMTAPFQGGRVFAQGGTASIPGSELMDVHVYTNVAAGVTVGFYQFA